MFLVGYDEFICQPLAYNQLTTLTLPTSPVLGTRCRIFFDVNGAPSPGNIVVSSGSAYVNGQPGPTAYTWTPNVANPAMSYIGLEFVWNDNLAQWDMYEYIPRAYNPRSAGIFNMTFTQPSGYSKTVACRYSQSFNTVALQIQAMSSPATASDTAVITSNVDIPLELRPYRDVTLMYVARSGSTYTISKAVISCTGTITLYLGLSTFPTGTATSGIYNDTCFTWVTNTY